MEFTTLALFLILLVHADEAVVSSGLAQKVVATQSALADD